MKPRIYRLSEEKPRCRRVLSAAATPPLSGKQTSWVTITRTGSFTDPRYSQYIVKSQGRGKHDGKGDAADAGVKRYRPLLILAEDQSQSPAARAKHEATMREGKADRAEIKVQSWRQGGDKGELWLPGLRVQVKAAHIHKDDEEMIISEIEYSLNDQEGTVATLQLANPKAYDQLRRFAAPLAARPQPRRHDPACRQNPLRRGGSARHPCRRHALPSLFRGRFAR